MTDHTNTTASRRNVLKTAGGLLAGGALFSTGAAATRTRAGKYDETRRSWTGEYTGRLDGRTADLRISAYDYDTLKVTLDDRDRNVTFEGYEAVPSGSSTHVLDEIHMHSGDGHEKILERLYRHGFDDDHISGYTRWNGGNYGVAFASKDSGGVESTVGSGGTLDDEDWPDQWEYIYHGRNDGRNADLYIRVIDKTSRYVQFFVGLYDRDRNVYFTGKPYSLRSSPKHILDGLILETDDRSQWKRIDRLYLHTWDTNYVSGRTKWRGGYYGLHFAQAY